MDGRLPSRPVFAPRISISVTPGALIAAKLNREPQALRERFPELDVPIALEELLRATLAREPTRRPRDAEAMTRTLVAIATSATDVGGSVDLIGRSVGSYEVKRLLGVGGTGSVYLAEHPLIGMRVAVKILAPELASNSEFVERFIRKWNFYLQYCEAAFATRNISVIQATYTRPNNTSLHRAW